MLFFRTIPNFFRSADIQWYNSKTDNQIRQSLERSVTGKNAAKAIDEFKEITKYLWNMRLFEFENRLYFVKAEKT